MLGLQLVELGVGAYVLRGTLRLELDDEVHLYGGGTAAHYQATGVIGDVVIT